MEMTSIYLGMIIGIISAMVICGLLVLKMSVKNNKAVTLKKTLIFFGSLFLLLLLSAILFFTSLSS